MIPYLNTGMDGVDHMGMWDGGRDLIKAKQLMHMTGHKETSFCMYSKNNRSSQSCAKCGIEQTNYRYGWRGDGLSAFQCAILLDAVRCGA